MNYIVNSASVFELKPRSFITRDFAYLYATKKLSNT